MNLQDFLLTAFLFLLTDQSMSDSNKRLISSGVLLNYVHSAVQMNSYLS